MSIQALAIVFEITSFYYEAFIDLHPLENYASYLFNKLIYYTLKKFTETIILLISIHLISEYVIFA